MHTQTLNAVGLQQRTAELALLIGSLLSDVHAVLARSDQHAEPTPDDWSALEIQMNALAELQRAHVALGHVLAAPADDSVDRPEPSARMQAPRIPDRFQRLLMAA